MCDNGSDSAADLMGYSEHILPTDDGMGLLDCVTLPLDRSGNPLILWTPVPGNPAFPRPFSTIIEWREFILSHNLHAAIPKIIAAKFQRAQKLYFLAWIDLDVIKAGELMALAALEFALKARYGNEIREKKRSGEKKIPPHSPQLYQLLEYIVEADGLTNEQIPMFQKRGYKIVENLYETKAAKKARENTGGCAPTTISGIRNSLAHGDPFDILPWGGLLELVHDLIEYAYRNLIAERTS
jgi:hypothetical protein